LRDFISTAQAMAIKQIAKVIGFSDQACSNCPRLIAPIARVPPQPGQGYPVNSRTGQIIGPSSNRFVRKDNSLTSNQMITKAKTRRVLVPNIVVVELLLE